MRQIESWEPLFTAKIEEISKGAIDPAHDLAHFGRVVATSRLLMSEEGGDPWVVIPAAWLHDLVNVPKNDPRRSQASRLSAEQAIRWLRQENYPERFLPGIAHAIEAHSYSAAIPATTLEARIVQDADRLDGVGAVGIARCFTVGALLSRPLYESQDPFARGRDLDDGKQTLDHFYVKLFRTIESLQTDAGKREGARRAQTMQDFLNAFAREIGAKPRGF